MSPGVAVEKSPTQTATGHADVPPHVRSFCDREGISRELDIALALLWRCFPSVRAEVDLTRDPESDEERVSIHIRFAGTREDFSMRYRRYTREWIARTSWPARDRFPLSYGII
jgi:hypothetical protein